MKTQEVSLKKLSEIKNETKLRMLSGLNEWDRVLGNGILPGSFTILTGDPGAGKSTMLLQVASGIAKDKKVVYFSSEESLQQIKNRADRLKLIDSAKTRVSNLLFSDQTNLENIIEVGIKEKPDLIILDSIQTCSLSGSSASIPGVNQLKEIGFNLCKLAKENDIAIIVTGQVTKKGQIAGPRALEHIVDGIFYLQCESGRSARVLRSVKNRFGTLEETGSFEMGETGLTEATEFRSYFFKLLAGQ